MATAAVETVTQQVEHLRIADVRPSPDNPRSAVGDVSELAMSIKSVGVKSPICVVPRDDHYEVVYGHRRLAAAELAGNDTIPAIIEELDDQERLVVMTIENLQRADLTPLEEARAYQRLIDELQLTQRDLEPRVGKTQGHISKRLALLRLPKDVQSKVDSGGITIPDALELAKLADHPKRLKAVMNGPGYQPLEVRVRHELEAVKVEKKIVELEEDLESKAVATIRVASDWSLPKGVHRLKGGKNYDAHALDLTAKQHEGFECHAIAISERDGLGFPVCTNRKNHPKVKTKQEKDSGVARVGQRARAPRESPATKLLNEARARRLAFAGSLLAKRPPKEAIALMLRERIEFVLEDFGMEDGDLARVLVWLGLMPAPEDGAYTIPDDVDAVSLILSFADRGDAELQRAAFALYIAEAEGGFTSDVTRYVEDGARRTGLDWTTNRAKAILEFLRSQGDTLTDVETKRLDEAAKEAA